MKVISDGKDKVREWKAMGKVSMNERLKKKKKKKKGKDGWKVMKKRENVRLNIRFRYERQ